MTCKKSFRAHGKTLVKFHEADDSYITETFGSPWYFAHRVDLHEELKLLATQEGGEGKPAVVNLRSEVVKYVRVLRRFNYRQIKTKCDVRIPKLAQYLSPMARLSPETW